MRDDQEKKIDNQFMNDILREFEPKQTSYVRVTDDLMTAWLYLEELEDGKRHKKEEVLKLLRDNRVTAGLNMSNINAMVKKGVYGREIKVATAILPVEGKNGYYEYLFETERKNKKPTVKEDGSLDYMNMILFESVEEGTVIAIYHEAEMGTCGTNVYGDALDVKPVRELMPIKGRGIVRSSENPNHYLAGMDGKIEYEDGKLNITNIFEVKDDVDFTVGNISFPGDIVIGGNVSAGISIRAGKSITIEGNVEAASIYANGDIVLKRGIQGNHKGKIVTKGSFYADFIEHATVFAENQILANSILNSEVISHGEIILTGKKGALIGGNAHADRSVVCKTLGNDVYVKTVVHVGVMPELLETYVELMKIGERTEGQELQLKKIIESITNCMDSFIRVEGNIYTNSVICVGSNRQVIERNTSYTEYRNINSQLEQKVIATN